MPHSLHSPADSPAPLGTHSPPQDAHAACPPDSPPASARPQSPFTPDFWNIDGDASSANAPIPNSLPDLPPISSAPVPAQTGGKQPNFLQKLFTFLALNPHPCPDVIYWAADSKQLVIAQPDELARDFLPRLFKHDKIASFGRQLNIYGFARVYPGRQFKDDQGQILDASVWAHPSLHRCSTPDQIASVKRRAAPKLFRTRRLANGRVVRTRAGPEVERKFREIKEDMQSERNGKHTGGAAGAGRRTSTGSTASATTSDWEEGAWAADRGEARHDGRERVWLDAGHMVSVGPSAQAYTPLDPEQSRLYEWPSEGYERDFHDVALSPFSPSYPPQASATLQHQHPHPRSLLSSITEGSPLLPTYTFEPEQTYEDPLHQAGGEYGDSPLVSPIIDPRTQGRPLVPANLGNLGGRYYYSCPASIHTSPILAPRSIDGLDTHGTSISTQVPMPAISLQAFPPSYVANPLSHGLRDDQLANRLQLRVDTQTPAQTQRSIPRIAAPAAPYPFAFAPTAQPSPSSTLTPFESSPVDLDTRPNTAYSTSPTALMMPPSTPIGYSVPVTASHTPFESTSREASVWPEVPRLGLSSWERTGSIDPRWVSPRGSAWNTPAPTPRSGSPVQASGWAGVQSESKGPGQQQRLRADSSAVILTSGVRDDGEQRVIERLGHVGAGEVQHKMVQLQEEGTI